jgi:hypothetical protein
MKRNILIAIGLGALMIPISATAEATEDAASPLLSVRHWAALSPQPARSSAFTRSPFATHGSSGNLNLIHTGAAPMTRAFSIACPRIL